MHGLIAAGGPDKFPTGGAEHSARLMTNFLSLLPFLVLGVVVVVIGAVVIWWVRRRMRPAPPTGPIAEGASLSTFRQMRDRGQLSEQEYQVIRRNLVEKMREDMDL